MQHYLSALVLLYFCSMLAAADVLGPMYPTPLDLSSNSSAVLVAWTAVSSILDEPSTVVWQTIPSRKLFLASRM